MRKLDQRVVFPTLDLPIDLDVTATTDLENIEEVAAAVRERWRVEPGPVPSVIRLLELHGVVVTRYLTGSERLDAFSIPFPAERPIVVLGDDKGHFDRSRFDAAHELGHLVMHLARSPATARSKTKPNASRLRSSCRRATSSTRCHAGR